MTATTLPELRLHVYREQPVIARALSAVDAAVAESGLDPTLRDLVLLRASQINGCAYCVDMHSKDLRRSGESEQRVYGVSAWHEAPYYSERERAALALTEAMTLIADGIPEQVYDDAADHFEPNELAALIWAVAVINTWNRVAITARDPVPGTYEPR
jgi:AhpD family alkylhydroperoxidase